VALLKSPVKLMFPLLKEGTAFKAAAHGQEFRGLAFYNSRFVRALVESNR